MLIEHACNFPLRNTVFVSPSSRLTLRCRGRFAYRRRAPELGRWAVSEK